MSYTHLNAKERHTLMYLSQYRLSSREIGRRLGRHHSSIARELRRNAHICGGYRDDTAHHMAEDRRKQPRHIRRWANGPLTAYVLSRLREDWSPGTIVGRLKLDFPRSRNMCLSVEQIYQWIYRDAAASGLLYRHLLRRHKRRRRQGLYGLCRGLIPGRVSIHDRPESIARRGRFGHWEGDTVEGEKGTGGIATHVERKSRMLIAAKLKDKRAETFTRATISAFNPIPNKWRRSLTVDNGGEFAGFKAIEAAVKLDVYFADPYAPWQRGTNENTNGLLRHYFPKGIDWRKVGEKQLAQVVRKLNNRPRKCLNYQTPNEVFLKNTGVALAT